MLLSILIMCQIKTTDFSTNAPLSGYLNINIVNIKPALMFDGSHEKQDVAQL